MSTLDVVAEREESVRTESHTAVLCYPCLLLLHCEHLGLLLEEHLPCSVTQNVVMVLRDIYVDGVVAVSATDVVHEGKIHHLRVLAKPPDVSLVACEACAVNAALLSGTDADGLTVLYVTYRVRLCILQCDERDDKVADGVGSEVLCLCGDVLEELRIVQTNLVASLLEGNAEHLLVLYRCGHVSGVYLYHVVCALALCLQNLDSLGSEVGCDYAVAHLTLDECGCGSVASVAKSHEVAVRAHAVGAAGTCISACNRRQLYLHVVNEINLLQRVAQRQAYCGSCGRDVLERRCGGQTGGCLQFLHKLP